VDAEHVGRLAFRERVEVLWLDAEASDLEQLFFALVGGAPDPAGVRQEVA
jgi:hypothetical protein